MSNQKYTISPRWGELGNTRTKPSRPISEALSELERKIEYLQGSVGESPVEPIYEGPRKISSADIRLGLFRFIEDWDFANDEFRSYCGAICQYFAGDPAFVDSPLVRSKKPSLEKGLLILGRPGIGKSETMKFMSKVIEGTPDSFKPLQVSHIIHNWTELKTPLTRKVLSEMQGEIKNHLLIDDIGREEKEKTYTYGFNPIRSLIEAREILWKKNGVKTHFITNFSSEDLATFYGDALIDRINGMCNVISLNISESKR